MTIAMLLLLLDPETVFDPLLQATHRSPQQLLTTMQPLQLTLYYSKNRLSTLDPTSVVTFHRYSQGRFCSCSSLGWPYLCLGTKNSRLHNAWLSDCNLTLTMRCQAVNSAIMQPCYLATNFIGGAGRGRGRGGQSSHMGVMAFWPPLRTANGYSCQNIASKKVTMLVNYSQPTLFAKVQAFLAIVLSTVLCIVLCPRILYALL